MTPPVPTPSAAPAQAAPSALYLCGATACGKSSIALALAQRIGSEIVNADAFQLYRGFDALTAKPSADDLRAVPHHLYSVLEAADTCDAQRYRDLALPVITDISARGRWPIVTGGSGLYVKALTHGLAPLPAADPAVRTRIAALTPDERVAELLRLDLDAARNVPLANDRYVSRALEICLLTGQPQSALRQSWQHAAPAFHGVLLVREREDLYHRINQRVLQMLDSGAKAEVRAALAAMQQGTLPDRGVFKAIGVREITTMLRGECTQEEAITAMQQATRRYAKRQGTWFRRERGFQTVCLAPDSTADFAVERILQLFPCLLQPPSSAPSS